MRATRLPPPTPRPTDRKGIPGIIAGAAGRMLSLPPWALLLQLFIGIGWTRAGAEKLISSQWWNGQELDAFLADHEAHTITWYEPLVDLVFNPAAILTSFVVMVTQLLVGAALIAGRRVGTALSIGMFLNLNFVAAGAVNPSVFYLLAQGALLLWMAERSEASWTDDVLEVVMMTGVTLMAMSTPWIQTISPADVIDDPAIMLLTTGAFAVVTSLLTYVLRLRNGRQLAHRHHIDR